MSADLSPVIAATTQWLLRSYPGTGGALDAALAEAQASQAVMVAAWLRYPTEADAALVVFVGPGGSDRLDWLTGAEAVAVDDAEAGWRSWVDEVVASWAACLLTMPSLARDAVAALDGSEHVRGLVFDFRRLTDPGEQDRRAVPLLRHPDLLAPLADLHRDSLVERLHGEPVDEGGHLGDPVAG
ncbi:hypothetical protein [Streptomyces sp. Ru72]|uniref:hypothetical protein n=1 Tax=Streptomyces sp. Ru72 TaxID=2080747 RepID=UPI000CDD3502|nr:hypothetical protein [Streptomyces sp. Ru72]POX40315.1 hypothetical protein C3488_38675 [Streptomyces sp. Ru72]